MRWEGKRSGLVHTEDTWNTKLRSPCKDGVLPHQDGSQVADTSHPACIRSSCCDSACWCNFIFPLPKKKLKAASSRTPLAFACVLRVLALCIRVCGNSSVLQIWVSHCEQCFSVSSFARSAQGWHTFSIQEISNKFNSYPLNFIFVWHFMFQVCASKGREGGFHFLEWRVFSFVPPPHPAIFFGESTIMFFTTACVSFVSQNTRGTPL